MAAEPLLTLDAAAQPASSSARVSATFGVLGGGARVGGGLLSSASYYGARDALYHQKLQLLAAAPAGEPPAGAALALFGAMFGLLAVYAACAYALPDFVAFMSEATHVAALHGIVSLVVTPCSAAAARLVAGALPESFPVTHAAAIAPQLVTGAANTLLLVFLGVESWLRAQLADDSAAVSVLSLVQILAVLELTVVSGFAAYVAVRTCAYRQRKRREAARAQQLAAQQRRSRGGGGSSSLYLSPFPPQRALQRQDSVAAMMVSLPSSATLGAGAGNGSARFEQLTAILGLGGKAPDAAAASTASSSSSLSLSSSSSSAALSASAADGAVASLISVSSSSTGDQPDTSSVTPTLFTVSGLVGPAQAARLAERVASLERVEDRLLGELQRMSEALAKAMAKPGSATAPSSSTAGSASTDSHEPSPLASPAPSPTADASAAALLQMALEDVARLTDESRGLSARCGELEERAAYLESELRRASQDVGKLRAALKDERKKNDKLFATLDLEREANSQAQTVIGDLQARAALASSSIGVGAMAGGPASAARPRRPSGARMSFAAALSTPSKEDRDVL